jgi:hypothetical protein
MKKLFCTIALSAICFGTVWASTPVKMVADTAKTKTKMKHGNVKTKTKTPNSKVKEKVKDTTKKD